MSEQKRLIPGLPPEGSMKSELGNLAWQSLIRHSETFPPQSISVEVKHGNYTYRGAAHLVEDERATMRVIMFRAWHKREQKMYPVVGMFHRLVCLGIGEDAMTTTDINEVELLQYANGRDMNENVLTFCEGDIIKHLRNTASGFKACIETIEDISNLPDISCSKNVEVIGNIYENPELVRQP